MTAKTGRAPTVAIVTHGCKLNQADAEGIARSLGGEGVRVVDRLSTGLDAVVINSCSVTHVADRKARHAARQARRLSPDAHVVLAGCYAETAPADIADKIGADEVVRRDAKAEIPERLALQLQAKGDPAGGCPSHLGEGLRTRAFIKIQEGCNELCAFCIVPYTRGREVSVPIDEVVAQVREREAFGVQEVVLTGTQLGNYGRDLGWTESGPRHLLEALLAETSVPRIRLSSLQAQDISPALLDLWRDPRLCPHFHLPLQSGSDAVLSRMRRRYTAGQFRSAAALIREHVPNVAITTDVIAGFPGETDQDFEDTARLCEDVGFAAIHAFPYSRRPQTAANRMDGQLPTDTRRERLERLLAIGRESARAFRQQYIGRQVSVLWEEHTNGLWNGLTSNYMRVHTPSHSDLANTITPAIVTSVQGDDVHVSLSTTSEQTA